MSFLGFAAGAAEGAAKVTEDLFQAHLQAIRDRRLQELGTESYKAKADYTEQKNIAAESRAEKRGVEKEKRLEAAQMRREQRDKEAYEYQAQINASYRQPDLVLGTDADGNQIYLPKQAGPVQDEQGRPAGVLSQVAKTAPVRVDLEDGSQAIFANGQFIAPPVGADVLRQQRAAPKAAAPITDADIKATAQKYNMTELEVRRQLELRGLL